MKTRKLLSIALALALLLTLIPVFSSSEVFSFDATAGYYYIVKGNFDAFYVDASGNRYWMQTYQWDIDSSYTIFYSPISGKVYLVPSTSAKLILDTRSWFKANPFDFNPTITITVTFPSPWSRTETKTVSPSVSTQVSYLYNGSVVVSNTTTLVYSVKNMDFGATTVGYVQTGATYTASISISGGNGQVRFNFTARGYTCYFQCYDHMWTVNSETYVSLEYQHAYNVTSTASVKVTTTTTTSGVGGMNAFIIYANAVTQQFTYSRTHVFKPDAFGRIVASNGAIIIDATDRLEKVDMKIVASYLSLALYTTTLRVKLYNDTSLGFLVILDTSGFAEKIAKLNPVVYIREVNRFYPLSIYGFNTNRTVIAVPAKLPAGIYTVDIIWHFPFVQNTFKEMSVTVYEKPSEVLSLLMVQGDVEVQDIYRPYYVKIIGNVSLNMLSGKVVEIEYTYRGNEEAPLSLSLQYVPGEDTIFFEVPLPNGTTLRTSVAAYPGALYAPHLYDWYFDGIDDYIVVRNFPNYESLTISFWAKVHGDSDRGVLVGTRWNWDDYGFDIEVTSPPHFLMVAYGTNPGFRYVATYPITDWTWTHFTVILPNIDVDRAKLFVNGVYVDNWGIGFVNNPAPYDLYIGWSEWQRYSFKGWISNVVIHNRILSSPKPPWMNYNPEWQRYSFKGWIGTLSLGLTLFSLSLESLTEVEWVYNHVIPANGLVLFLDPTFFNGTHFIDLSDNNNHGVGYYGVTRVPAEMVWIYTILNSTAGNTMTFTWFPIGTKISYAGQTITVGATGASRPPMEITNGILYVRKGDGWYGETTIYRIKVYDTIYPIDPAKVDAETVDVLAVKQYPINMISLVMGVAQGAWGYRIPVYISFAEQPASATVVRVRLPLGLWIRQGLLSPSLEDLCIVDESLQPLPFMVMYWEDSDNAIIYVRYPRPPTSKTITLYVYLRNELLWGTGTSFQTLTTFDLINPREPFTFRDPVWGYTVVPTYGVFNYFVFTSWDRVAFMATPFDGVIIVPRAGKLIVYRGTYTEMFDIVPIDAKKELSFLIRGTKIHIYADGMPAISIDVSTFGLTGIQYVGWAGTDVYVSTTSFYTYTAGSVQGGVAPAIEYQVKDARQTVAAPRQVDAWGLFMQMVPFILIIVLLGLAVRIVRGGGLPGGGGREGFRLP